ncbi:MAG: hydroxyacid dehydrogenase, partial [Candidatus Aenigmarchaeota archaeon]|nr:hydroxyacid dehydrogenase [Candidatus Aenigmarchaeota archaeon]
MKIVISSRSFGKINPKPIDMLKNAGFEVVLNPINKKLNENELIELIDDAIGLIAGTEPITENVLNHAKALKVISRYGVGLDNIDLDAPQKRDIEVYNTPNAPAKAVAELTLSLILNLMRCISESSQPMKDGMWQPQMGHSLYGKKLGIIGLGRIGKELV